MTEASRLTLCGLCIRIAVCLAYIAVVLFGVWKLACDRSAQIDSAYVARRALPAGHRVRPGDLDINPELSGLVRVQLNALPPPEGRYLICARSTGQTIGVAQLSDTPPVQAVSGEFNLAVPIASDWVSSGVVDVGTVVALCTTECKAEGLRIAALICSGAAATCTALLNTNKRQVEALVAHFSDLHLVIQSAAIATTSPTTVPSEPGPTR